MTYVKVEKIIFTGKQNIDWKGVERYMKRFQGKTYRVVQYQDDIHINLLTLEEYTGSQYTWRLKGALAKVKANIVQILPQLLECATNRRWVENQNGKHGNEACKGWYRYDTYFSMPVADEKGNCIHWNHYSGTIIVRINDMGVYLYDIINIKKEARNPR